MIFFCKNFKSVYSSITCFFKGTLARKTYGIIYPYKQVLQHNQAGRLTCHSATSPEWLYRTYYDKKATLSTIPPNSTIGDSLLITGINEHFTQYICRGTHPGGSHFQADAFIYRASKRVLKGIS